MGAENMVKLLLCAAMLFGASSLKEQNPLGELKKLLADEGNYWFHAVANDIMPTDEELEQILKESDFDVKAAFEKVDKIMTGDLTDAPEEPEPEAKKSKKTTK